MRSVNPAQVIYDVVIVLRLGLVCLRSRSELESRCQERELVNALGKVARWPRYPGIVDGHGIDVVGRVVDVNQSESYVVHQPRRKHVSFGNDEQTIVNRQLIREVQV